MASNNEALVLTPKEAMKILRCSRSVLYAGLKNGCIPCIRLGPRKVVIPRKKLMVLLEGANDGAHPQE
ncbi:hypothetical protein ES705_47363 [subsurface metagenome]